LRSKALIVDERFGREYAGHYVFGEITWAKRSRIIQKHTKYSKVTGQVECSDLVAIQAETVIASLKEQPENKPITLEKMLDETDGIPVDLGELLGNLANKLCNVSKEETVFLSEQSGEKSQTKPSPNSDSAKSSDGPPASLEMNQQEKSSNSS
jgi:hypothetical protein